MNIGIIAYNAACNFGANLQLLSTVEYIRKSGDTPFVINWCPLSLENIYTSSISREQQEVHKEFRIKYYNETDLCRDAKDVATVISKNDIKGVIVGSDAVVQHHPLISRILFPSKTIISILPNSEEREFPNVFWGTFNQYLDNKVPIAFLSVSCQNSSYSLFSERTRNGMKSAIEQLSYISVRDEWTQKMFKHVSNGTIVPSITPDPVFAFNYNVDYVPSKEYIQNKFGLPEKYVLFGLHNKRKITDKWISEFVKIADQNGCACFNLPFPAQNTPIYSFNKTINLPLDPLEWYALIKYAYGYIGHNMHPIVVALHNSVPFFCIDHYGVTKFRIFLDEKSSKIYDILNRAGFNANRMSDGYNKQQTPMPENVWDMLVSFNHAQCKKFTEYYYSLYTTMMDDIIKTF